MVSLDVENVFNAVWHNGLRYKLTMVPGLPEKLLRLLSNYLTDRHILVRVGQSRSRDVTLRAGTPQGSVYSAPLSSISS